MANLNCVLYTTIYFDQAVANLQMAEQEAKTLFNL
jgi:hypothetical protein